MRATIYPEIGELYRHYKGGLYKVLTLARHTELDECLVVYQSVHFGSIHARPLHSWNEPTGEVSMTHHPIPRFKRETETL